MVGVGNDTSDAEAQRTEPGSSKRAADETNSHAVRPHGDNETNFNTSMHEVPTETVDKDGSNSAQPLHTRNRRRRRENVPGQYSCEVCSKTFASSTVYEDHMAGVKNFKRMRKNNNEQIMCTTCNVFFNGREDLEHHKRGKRHLRAAATQKVFHCELCDVTVPSDNDFQLYLNGMKHAKALRKSNVL